MVYGGYDPSLGPSYRSPRDQGSQGDPGGFFNAVLGDVRSALSEFISPLVGSFDQSPRGGGLLAPYLPGSQAQTQVQTQTQTRPSPLVFDRTGRLTGGTAVQPAQNPGRYAPTTRETRIAQKIVAESQRLGIDPDFALWVAENEGGLDDAAANRQNRQGSTAYGPYQLLIGGGLGDQALAAGIDPRDPNTWEQQIAFALEYAARNGWGPWEAVTARGIDPWTGIQRPAARPGALPGAAAVPGAAMPQISAAAAQRPTQQQQPASAAQVAPTRYRINVPYGQPYTNPTMRHLGTHRGVDLVRDDLPAQGRGGIVTPFESGRVAFTGFDQGSGGNYVVIQDANGYYHWYFHLDSVTAQPGQTVDLQTPIGTLGASGIDLGNPADGGPHLHYEVRQSSSPNSHVDPTPWMRRSGAL